MKTFNRELAATVVAESVLGGIKKTCDKYGISRKTLERWKKRLECDTAMAQNVASKMAKIEGDWAESLPGAIRAAIDFLKRAAENANIQDPDVIHSVAGGLKILSDVTMSRRVLDARLAKTQHARDSGAPGPAGEAHRESASAVDQLGLQ